MENLSIPQRLKNILGFDDALSGFVLLAVSEFVPWLKQNNVKFFTEYTDHSLEHIEKVLITTDDLIPEESEDVINSGDVAVLVLTSLLHDCAMHLSEEGFITLLRSDHVVEGFNDKSWLKLWADFIAESRRFPGRKLLALFGDTDAIKPPPADPDELEKHIMTPKDLLLIGEFLRKHHHRLAHEIAIYGVPGPDGHKLKFPEKEETKHIVNLAGVVARSHGLPIRACHDYLSAKYSNVISFKGVHPIYLMGVLRISDILQLQSDRAPKQVEKLRSFKSPISQGKWEMHQAIHDINRDIFPETIFIHAEPKNARTFLKIKRMLGLVQEELDSAWTIISEAYYSKKGLRALGYTIRRVRSNLDDVETFAKTVKYIPQHAAFEVADSDLLKLLIGPLYGERPEIGIRELMQNAVDAVRERDGYLKKHPELGNNIDMTEQEGEVVISINEIGDGWFVTVSDQGIGMTLDTVRDYFLKAGASLRRSEIWRKTFENEEGKSQVLRSGRFGVGVLAAFLLGHEVHVSTRHVTEPKERGIAFSAQLDAESIEVKKYERPVGTSVRVRITENTIEHLLKNTTIWDWYCLDYPKVVRTTKRGSNKLTQEYHLPTCNTELPPGWYRIFLPHYQDVQWTYKKVPELTCNGIEIIKFITSEKYKHSFFKSTTINEDFFEFYYPQLSIFDFDSNLPLNLQRDGLTIDRYQFHEELFNHVLKDLIAYMFVNAPTEIIANSSNFKWYSSFSYPPNSFNYNFRKNLDYYLFPWFITRNGISYAYCGHNIKRLESKSFFSMYLFSSKSYGLSEERPMPKINFSQLNSLFITGIDSFFYSKSSDVDKYHLVIKLALDSSYFYYQKFFYEYFKPGKRALISRHVLGLIEEVEKFEEREILKEELTSQITVEWKNDNWVLWRIGDCPPPTFDFKEFAAKNDGKNYKKWPCILAEWYLKEEKPDAEYEMTPLSKMWKEVMGEDVIPFDMKKRKKLKAWKTLKPYIDNHMKLKELE